MWSGWAGRRAVLSQAHAHPPSRRMPGTSRVLCARGVSSRSLCPGSEPRGGDRGRVALCPLPATPVPCSRPGPPCPSDCSWTPGCLGAASAQTPAGTPGWFGSAVAKQDRSAAPPPGYPTSSLSACDSFVSRRTGGALLGFQVLAGFLRFTTNCAHRHNATVTLELTVSSSYSLVAHQQSHSATSQQNFLQPGELGV